MKKVIAMFSIVALAACGGQKTSTDVVVDSTVVVDSVNQDSVVVSVDSTSVKAEQ